MGFTEISSRAIPGNVFDLIQKRWMLISAGRMGGPGDWNTMTANWGGLGHLWNRDVAFAFVRPTRHSFLFMEKEELFTLSFFGDAWRGALEYCGRFSGRDHDKAAETGLKAIEAAPGAVAFEQAELIFVCRKIHAQDLDPKGFLDPAIHEHYDDDHHRLYIGQILKTLAREA
ncbi:MAG TPA: flavin reductase [Spirochaetaceae bacterium]|nr:flavin reductase [Spirochaetaceae bacterium]